MSNANRLTRIKIWTFLKLCIPLCFVLLVFVAFLTTEKTNVDNERLKAEERNLVQVEKHVFETGLAAHVADAAFLAAAVSLLLPEAHGNGLVSPKVSKLFFDFAKRRNVYSQLRILDKDGYEQLRVNCKPGSITFASEPDLQHKAQRDYFLHGITLDRGTVFISQLDLNKEEGRIEIPFNPTLRLASPIKGQGGQHAGLVVLNFQGSALLKRMRDAGGYSLGNIYLTDYCGHWIIGPDPSLEWGHIIPERSGFLVSTAYPMAWPKIQKIPQGQFIDNSGLFTFAKFYIQAKAGEHVPISTGATGGWIIISFVPKAKLASPWSNQIIMGMVFSIMIFVVVCWFWASSKVNRQATEQDLRSREKMLAAISQSTQDAMVEIDSQDSILFWNSAAEKMFGYSNEEALKGKLHELLAPEPLKAGISKGMAHFAETGQGLVFGSRNEFTAKHKDGSELSVEVEAVALQDGDQWHAVGNMRDITERKKAEKRLRELATTDPLTGLANRRHFTDLALAEVNRTNRYGGAVSMIMFDVDHFKKVNDTYGHDVGDEVLKALCRTAAKNVRDVDTLGRLGGEEFGVLLPETGPEAAVEVAERLRSAVEKATAHTSAGQIDFTISLGVATSRGPDADMAQILKSADNAMYQAKNDGRNLVRVA